MPGYLLLDCATYDVQALLCRLCGWAVQSSHGLPLHAGHILILSTALRQIGRELHSQCYCPNGGVRAMAVSGALAQAAIAGSGVIRLLELTQPPR